VLFVIDEYKTFRNAVSRWYRSVKPKGPGGSQAPVLEEISDFVSLARKVRMHLLIGLQRPDAEFLTGDMRDNFNFRVSLGRLSPEGAKMMWDSFSTGVTINPKAKGRGIAHNSTGEAVEIQTFWTPDPYQTEPGNPSIWVTEKDLELVEQLRPALAIHQLKEIVDPEDEANLDGTDEKGPDYNDYMSSRIVVAGTEAARLKANGGFLTGETTPTSSRVAVLERIQREEAEPEIDDADEMFSGYQEPTTQVLDELLDDSGEFASEGVIALIDADNDLWGLVEFAEYDETEDGYMSIGYRDFETSEPGALSLPVDDVLTIRTPKVD
jgi:DNA segregation ATPase FtsK/SpoIIIE-like protein